MTCKYFLVNLWLVFFISLMAHFEEQKILILMESIFSNFYGPIRISLRIFPVTWRVRYLFSWEFKNSETDQPRSISGSGFCFWHEQYGITCLESVVWQSLQKNKKYPNSSSSSDYHLPEKKETSRLSWGGSVVSRNECGIKERFVVVLYFNTQLCWVTIGKSRIIP